MSMWEQCSKLNAVALAFVEFKIPYSKSARKGTEDRGGISARKVTHELPYYGLVQKRMAEISVQTRKCLFLSTK